MRGTQLTIIGKFGAPYGVKGWLKVHSFTQPVDNIIEYLPWQISIKGQWQALELEAIRPYKQGLVAKIVDCNDRDEAKRYTHANIAVPREALPATETGEYYWSDLTGLSVSTTQGNALGTVKQLMETGANDVLVINRVDSSKEAAIPFVMESIIKEVNLEEKTIIVDWDFGYIDDE